MLKVLGVVVVAVSLTGCGLTGFGDNIRENIQERGRDVADQSLENSMWFLCSAASIGSIKRRFGVNADMAQAYNAVCEEGSAVTVITGEE